MEYYPFPDDEFSATIKHMDNNKWFALIMNVKGKLYLNVKTKPEYSDILRNTYEYIIPAYHMNKEHWNTIIVSENVDEDIVKELIEQLLLNGGHIGDGVRPSERRKGYATEMIRLALEECKKLGIDRVLMVCYKDNIASAKSIINNGGILENEIEAEDGKIDQRYWISL